MSQVYSTEPQTSGRVIIETTHGPLEMQLWCRECPATTRFFLQLCLDGFYDDMVFHRIIPNFLIQTGALRQGEEKEMESSSNNDRKNNDKLKKKYRQHIQAQHALDRRKYELNSRIRFNHRGQVAMALGIDDDDNDAEIMQPQFFITLDEAPYLDGKHVVFGTISGPTFFNAARIGRTDIDETTNQPSELSEAPKIQQIKIMENPIHTDIVLSQDCPWKIGKKLAEERKGASKKKKRKGVKNINVLSFGDDFEGETSGGSGGGGGGMKSSHDLIQSKSLSKDVDKEVKKAVEETKDDYNNGNKNENEDEKPTNALKNKNDAILSEQPKHEQTTNGIEPKFPKEETVREKEASLIQESNKINKDKPSTKDQSKNTNISSQEKFESSTSNKGTFKDGKLSLLEARRAKYKQGTKDKQKREADTLQKLMAFQSKRTNEAKQRTDNDDENKDAALATRMFKKVNSNDTGGVNSTKKIAGGITYHGQVLEDDDDDDEGRIDWMKTRFKCKKHMDQDARLGGDGRDYDDYAVVDEKRSVGSGGNHSRGTHKRSRRDDDSGHRHPHNQRQKKSNGY